MQQEYTELARKLIHQAVDASKSHWKPAVMAGGVFVSVWWFWMWRKYKAFKAEIFTRLQTLSSTKAIGADIIQYTTYGEGEYPILVSP